MLIRSGNNYEDAERAVEHICFLADINRLYDNAVGLYDLDLALLVAQQSQKVNLSTIILSDATLAECDRIHANIFLFYKSSATCLSFEGNLLLTTILDVM